MTCLSEMQKALSSNPVKKSVHQQTDCRYCKEDATKYCHCSWCGATFDNLFALVAHMEGQ